MFGSEARIRRPVLLILVFGAFLALVGITASAQATLVTSNLSDVAIKSVVDGDAVTIRTFAAGNLRLSDLDPTAAVAATRETELQAALALVLASDGILEVRMERTDGTPIAVASLGAGGAGPGADRATGPAVTGRTDALLLPAATAGAATDLPVGMLLRERFPLRDVGGSVVGIVTVWRDGAPIVARLDAMRTGVVIVTLTAALIAAALLFLIFRSAQARLSRQTTALVEATHRDPLTDTLNHGAVVALLAGRIEAARTDGTAAIGVALVDIDNFRLLNDLHGHRVGDLALLTVLEALDRVVPDGVAIGRYGPDEFLVLAPTGAYADLEPAIERLRDALVDASLEVDAADRLPITVSAGLAAYPADAQAVTTLLATVAATLEAAKASGGDAIRVAGVDAPEETASSFDVLQGLVFAVDTKDRYTKRHSEDVARYAVFLAQQAGLDEVVVGAVRLAGLLHDVGKIGMPDHLLRKPGPLTADEYEIVKQHVVLGDLIVRDLPELDLVRAGIRHHHERWDGTGYIDGLAGEAIPLVARIVAVADTFSAMTTSRPYRKALPTDEAIRRLRAAAGEQLDPALVETFVHGLETVADAPMPGADPVIRLWTRRAVA